MSHVIWQSRGLQSTEYVEAALQDLAEQVGGVDAFCELLSESEVTRKQARRSALTHAIAENLVAASGETACAVATILGMVGLVAQRWGPPLPLERVVAVLPLFALVLTVFLAWEVRVVVSWYRNFLVPIFQSPDAQSASRAAVEAATEFYGKLVWRLARPGRALYPLTTLATMVLFEAPASWYLVGGAVAVVCAWAVNSQYVLRLFQTDLLAWSVLEGVEFTDEDRSELSRIRQGSGWYATLRQILVRLGRGEIEPIELYFRLQGVVSVAAIAVCMLELTLLEDLKVKLILAGLFVCGLLAVSASHFVRFWGRTWKPSTVGKPGFGVALDRLQGDGEDGRSLLSEELQVQRQRYQAVIS